MLQKSSSVLSILRANENATEHLIQSLVLIFIVALKFTKSRTVNGFQELLAGGSDVYMLGISAAWSMFSVISGSVQQKIVQKNHSMPFKGILLQFCYSTLAMFCRISAIVFFFAPAMGLFNLLMHWNVGKLPFKINYYDVTENGTLTEVVWKQINHYEELTTFRLDIFYISFLLLIPIHFLTVAAIKLKFSREFKSRKDYRKKIFHILHQGIFWNF